MYPYYNPSEATCASIDWKFGRLEAWKFGGAQEVEARAVAYGDDVTSRCAAITVQAQRAKPSTAKDTKNHKGTQRLPVWETADYGEHRGTQRRQRGTEAGGVLPPAGLPVCFRLQGTQRVLQRLTESTAQEGGPCVRARRTSGPKGLKGHGGLRTPCFGEGVPEAHTTWFRRCRRFRRYRSAPAGRHKPFCRAAVAAVLEVLCVLYVLPRCPMWHVADVPGVQGELLPAGVWGSAPHLQSFNLPIS